MKKKCLKKGHKRRAIIYGVDQHNKPFTAGQLCKRCGKVFRMPQDDGFLWGWPYNSIQIPIPLKPMKLFNKDGSKAYNW